MKKNRIFLILLVIVLISGWFYWFQYRPVDIRKTCAKEATKDTRIKRIENDRYRECLVKHGFKPESLFPEADIKPVTTDINNGKVENAINDLKSSVDDSLEQQRVKVEDEFNNSANCESNGGRYQGNGLCVYF